MFVDDVENDSGENECERRTDAIEVVDIKHHWQDRVGCKSNDKEKCYAEKEKSDLISNMVLILLIMEFPIEVDDRNDQYDEYGKHVQTSVRSVRDQYVALAYYSQIAGEHAIHERKPNKQKGDKEGMNDRSVLGVSPSGNEIMK